MTFHPRNPRTIDPAARAKLKAAMQKGYVGGVVWNRRTGHIVGGNQRVGVLDDLHKGEDYALEVDVVDVDDKREGELLVSLNNEGMMGSWQPELLEDLLHDIDPFAAGFDKLDLAELCPDADFSSLFSDANEPEVVKKATKTLEEMKAEKKRCKAEGKENNDGELMIHLVADDAAQCRKFLAKLGAQDGYPYVPLFQLKAVFNIDVEGD